LDRPSSAGRAPVNGIEMYYELHGPQEGVPLVLIPGGGSTIDTTFGRILPHLAARRRIVALEEQGHGRTTDRDAPVAFETSADDVAALARHLGFGEVDIFGFSNGASIGLQVAIRHPQLVRKLVFASAMTKRDGADPGLWKFVEAADISNMPQPLKDAFLQVTPDERKLKTMHDKDAARMRGFTDVPDALLERVRAEVLILTADRDIVRLDHAVALSRAFKGARLAILPAAHGDYIGEAIAMRGESALPAVTTVLIEEFLGR
jgi:pimeloyl-ACP methyl ester carboxylesterase